MIFSIRSCHLRQTSYFGKFNISRVCAEILKPTILSALGAIHTDTASDAVMRNSFANSLQVFIDDEISKGNIKSNSVASCNDNDNSDPNTNGGEKLVIRLTLWFKKLVEKVNIIVVATDSTVTSSVS